MNDLRYLTFWDVISVFLTTTQNQNKQISYVLKTHTYNINLTNEKWRRREEQKTYQIIFADVSVGGGSYSCCCYCCFCNFEWLSFWFLFFLYFLLLFLFYFFIIFVCCCCFYLLRLLYIYIYSGVFVVVPFFSSTTTPTSVDRGIHQTVQLFFHHEHQCGTEHPPQ